MTYHATCNGMVRLLRFPDDGLPMRQTEITEYTPQATARRAEILWTSKDVADFLQVSLRWVEKQRALGNLPCLPLPGRRLVRYDPERVRTWALERAIAGQGG
jgi:hypothetical protein